MVNEGREVKEVRKLNEGREVKEGRKAKERRTVKEGVVPVDGRKAQKEHAKESFKTP